MNLFAIAARIVVGEEPSYPEKGYRGPHNCGEPDPKFPVFMPQAPKGWNRATAEEVSEDIALAAAIIGVDPNELFVLVDESPVVAMTQEMMDGLERSESWRHSVERLQEYSKEPGYNLNAILEERKTPVLYQSSDADFHIVSGEAVITSTRYSPDWPPEVILVDGRK